MTVQDNTPEITRNAPKLLHVDDSTVQNHLNEMVRTTVEETLNQLLDQEADELCGAKRYEHSAERVDTRAGYYPRTLTTRAGKLNLKVPKLRKLPFDTQIIERYKRRESSVEEALVEMYLAGLSVRRVEDISEALWGTRVSASTVSDLNQQIYGRIDEWRNRPLEGDYPYLYLDGICLKRSWGGEVRNVSVLVAMGVNREGYREILAVAEGMREDKASWLSFLRSLKSRGIKGLRLVTSDACIGLIEALGEVFPQADHQRCIVHWYRNILSCVAKNKRPAVARLLKAIHAQEDREAAQAKAVDVVAKLRAARLGKAADKVESSVDQTLTYLRYPAAHQRRIRSNNPLERLMREIRRRTRVVGAFPDGQSAVMLAGARLRHVAATRWGSRRYLDMDKLYNIEEENEYLDAI